VRPPGQPNRNDLDGEDGVAYDQVIEREQRRGGVDSEGKINLYYGSLLQSPQMAYHIAALGKLVRVAADRGDTYSHAEREWVDQVLTCDLHTNVVMRGHLEDGLAQGVRPEAIKALREGREKTLTSDEQELTDYIREVTGGCVTDESYARIEQRLGRRGAVEFTIFISYLLMTIRLIQALTGSGGPTGKGIPTDEELMREIGEYISGAREIPAARAMAG
jgi:hypothetical protein